MHFPVVALALITASLLAGCGQMGPLYAPEASPTASRAPATTTAGAPPATAPASSSTATPATTP